MIQTMNSNQNPIFIGGAGRSGTTLLRVILDSHSRICCGPELKVTPLIAQMWHSFQSAQPALAEYEINSADITGIFQQMFQILTSRILKKSQKSRIAEKTPGNASMFLYLFCIFPKSPLIQMVRDPRAVVASLLKMDWIDASTGKPLDYVSSAQAAARYWLREVTAGRQILAHPEAAKNYLELRYEDLILNPEKSLKKVFEHLGEAWEPSVLEFHQFDRNLAGESSAQQVNQPLHSEALERWRSELSPGQISEIDEITAALRGELGYD